MNEFSLTDSLPLYINSLNVGLSIDHDIRQFLDQRSFRYRQFVDFVMR
jgi:hypothetical protein